MTCAMAALEYCRGERRAIRGDRRRVGAAESGGGVVVGGGVGALGGDGVLVVSKVGMGLFARVRRWWSFGVVLTMWGAVGLEDVSPFVGGDCWVHGSVVVWSTSSMAECRVSSACCCCWGVRVAMHLANSRMTSRVCSVGVSCGTVQWVGKSS